MKGAQVTLDLLLQLVDLLSERKNNAAGRAQRKPLNGAHLHDLISMLSAENSRAETVSALILRLHILAAAHSDPTKTEALLLANVDNEENNFPLLDLSHWPQVRYAVSGELQTPESEAYFHSVTSAATVLRTAIIEAERAKGVPAFYILDNVLNLNSALPERYKKMANILY